MRAGAVKSAGSILAIFLLAALSGCASTRKETPAQTSTTTASGAPVRTEPPVSKPATLPGAPAATAWMNAKSIQVGLVVGAGKLLVAGSKEWKLRIQGGREIATVRAGAPLRIARIEAGAFEVFREREGAPLWSGTPADTLLLLPSDQGYSGWGGKWYRGTFRVFTSQPNGLTLVNVVGIEDYLQGVLPHEIGTPPESDFEAVKAQAVAARSYTLSYLGRRGALGFDLYASVEDQVYGGIGRENAQSERALNATRGEVIVSDGAPIRALYSSACGGRTANVEDVWPWPRTDYLRSVLDADGEDAPSYCSASANYRWREEWDVAAFMTTLRRFGPAEGGTADILSGGFLDVRVKSRGRCGRVEELALTTTEGDWILRGDRTRWGLRRPGQDAILRSSFFKIGVARDEDGRPVRVIANGAGNGHGIGLCQFGAMGMARSGKSYRAILSHYYKNTSIARAG